MSRSFCKGERFSSFTSSPISSASSSKSSRSRLESFFGTSTAMCANKSPRASLFRRGMPKPFTRTIWSFWQPSGMATVTFSSS